MLLISLCSFDSHRPRMQCLDVLHLCGIGIFDGRCGNHVDALGELVADAAADHKVREVAAVEDVVWRGACMRGVLLLLVGKRVPMYWSIVDILPVYDRKEMPGRRADE